MISLAQFYDELARHDWYYDQSDIHSRWCAGLDNKCRLAQLADLGGPQYRLLMGQYGAHMDAPTRNPKPERPKED